MLALKLRQGGSRVQYLGINASASHIGTSSLMSKPVGVISGDLLIGGVTVNLSGGPATWTPPAGWTERIDQGASQSVEVATLTAGGAEPSSYTFSNTGSGSGLCFGNILAFRNATYDTIGSFGTLANAGSLVMPSITMSGAGVLLAIIASGDQTGLAQGAPAGMTLINSATSGSIILSLYQQIVNAGATGTRTSAITGTGNSSGVLVGIKSL